MISGLHTSVNSHIAMNYHTNSTESAGKNDMAP
jgi:hypothetical protein